MVSKESLIELTLQAEQIIGESKFYKLEDIQRQHDLIKDSMRELAKSHQNDLVSKFMGPLEFCEKGLDKILAERKRPRYGY
ncbi:MAG: hypothetical protein ACYCQI_06435 [Gammaproteobacteria bacterium]